MLEPATLRALLMRAWRERWTDVQWGIKIRAVLPRYISGDIYHLSDCLLEQALVGGLPNQLILSYLMHSLAAQIVTYGGVMESISKCKCFLKLHCTKALLKIMDTLMENASCKGKAEDCLLLANALVSAVNWLVQIHVYSAEHIMEGQSTVDNLANFNFAKTILENMTKKPFIMCMLHLGSRDESSKWAEGVRILCHLEQLVASATFVEEKESLLKTITLLRDERPFASLFGLQNDSKYTTQFIHSVHAIIMLEVHVFLTRDSDIVARQLLLLRKFKGKSLTEMYVEILKACFIGLGAQEERKHQELKWSGFTYVKLPSVIGTMHRIIYGTSASTSDELLRAFQSISRMTTLLDIADYRVKLNCIEYLLKEFLPKSGNPGLLNERDAQLILTTRVNDTSLLPKPQNSEVQGGSLGNPDLILRALPTVSSILKSVSNKTTDSVLPVLSLLIGGKSRQLLLIAAASSGNLHTYAQQFVKINEQSKKSEPGESPQMCTNRAMVFDISFILLCHIAQIYGTEVVVSKEKETFIEQWITQHLPELGKVKPVLDTVTESQQNMAAEFIRRMQMSDKESMFNSMDFGVFCEMATLAMREVVHSSMTEPSQAVMDFLSKTNYAMNCLPVCQTAFLCSYLQTGGEEAEIATNYFKYIQEKLLKVDVQQKVPEDLKDRLELVTEMVENMVGVMKGNALIDSKTTQPYEGGEITSMNIDETLDTLLSEQVWKCINTSSGLITHKALFMCQDLFRIGNINWFVSSFVESLFETTFEDELYQAIDIIYGLFHIDIVGCTMSYLLHALPVYINNPIELSEPHCSGLALLTAKLITCCWAAVQSPAGQNEKNSSIRKGVKRSASVYEGNEPFDTLVSYVVEKTPAINSMGLNQEGVLFVSAVNNVFRLMTQMSRDSETSPVVKFMAKFLHYLVSLPHSSGNVSLLPTAMLTNLMLLLPMYQLVKYSELLVLSASDPANCAPSHEKLDSDRTSHTFQGDLALHAHTKTKISRQSAAKILCTKRNLEMAGLNDEISIWFNNPL